MELLTGELTKRSLTRWQSFDPEQPILAQTERSILVPALLFTKLPKRNPWSFYNQTSFHTVHMQTHNNYWN